MCPAGLGVSAGSEEAARRGNAGPRCCSSRLTSTGRTIEPKFTTGPFDQPRSGTYRIFRAVHVRAAL